MYVQETSKKNVTYTFWARPTIAWKLSCETETPRDLVVRAASFEKEKEPLNETAIIVMVSLCYGFGFIGTLVLFVLFAIRKVSGSIVISIGGAVCGGIQFIMLGITALLVWGQRGELGERLEAMQDLEFVNDCGDQFTHIPADFVPEIERAGGHIMISIAATIAMTMMSLATAIACACGGNSNDDEDDHKYDQVPLEEEE